MRALLRALANLPRLVAAPVWLCVRWLPRPKPEWVVLRLQPRLTQFRPRAALLRRLLTRAPPQAGSSLEELRELADQMVGDDRIRGLLLHVPALEAGWATCQSVRDAIATLRGAGKQVVCYLSEGGANRELYIALAADRIYMVPFSALGPLGMAANPLYFRTLLARLGLEVEVQSCGEYKSAAEPALRDTLSEPAREQLEALLWAMHNGLVEALRERRGLSPEAVTALFRRGLVGAAEALASGVIDGLAYNDELAHLLQGVPDGADDEAAFERKCVSSAAYVRRRAAPLWRPLTDPAHIAVVPLRGTIAGDHGGSLRTGVRHAQVAPTLRSLAKDAKVAAVVLYIESPGGSAFASELIHREVIRLARTKPVVAYFGDVAASGGYYIGCACRRIVSQPLTITGSIGVVSAKVAAAKLLSRLGIAPQRVATTDSADIYSFARALSPNEQQQLQAHAAELYDRFVAVVAEGRKRPAAEIEPLARGRVWTGHAAHERGLVDVLGGLERAVDEARSLLDGMPSKARAGLSVRLYPIKAKGGLQTLPDLGGATLNALFGGAFDLELLSASRRELALYYAPLAASLPL